MALREKFGRLVLLEETEAGALGREYRAARLGPSGLDRLVTVLRLSPAISAHAEATRRLMEEARLAARLSNPGLVRVLGIGRVEQSFYVSTELLEGRSLATILERCRGEAFPFAAEHALMVASRGASALESLHARKDEAGGALIHGLVAPARVVVAFDGEVKIKGLGLWAALRSTELLPPEERRYLAPEQAAGGPGGPRSDVYSFGLVLLEGLTGQAPAGDALDALADARVTNASGEQSPLPTPLADLLRRALAPDPGARFGGMADMRKAVDALLFSGDFAPTTFDLAFFMHTLFREEMEAEARALEEARVADYREFLPEDKTVAPTPPAPSPATEPEPPPASMVPPGAPTEVPPPALAAAAPERPPSVPLSAPDFSGSRPAAPRPSRDTSAREAAARMTLGSAPEPESRRGLGLLLGLVAAVVVGGGAGWYYFARMRPAPTPVATLSPEAAAAQARVRELEERIAQLETEKLAAETAAAEDARRKVEAQAGGRPVDPAAVERAQEEARRRARAEQERKQQEELARLATEKVAEEQRLAEASPPPATPAPTTSVAAAAPVATPTPTPAATAAGELAAPAGAPASEAVTPAASAATPGSGEVASLAGPAGAPLVPAPAAVVPSTPTPAPTPAVRRGTLVDVSDPTVTPPALVRQPAVIYPEMARQARMEGVVELRALVDENGNVIDVKLVRTSRPGYRFEAEADRHTRGRKYRPATKGGVAVRVWLPIIVNFKAAR